jgi:hypothetical protein
VSEVASAGNAERLAGAERRVALTGSDKDAATAGRGGAGPRDCGLAALSMAADIGRRFEPAAMTVGASKPGARDARTDASTPRGVAKTTTASPRASLASSGAPVASVASVVDCGELAEVWTEAANTLDPCVQAISPPDWAPDTAGGASDDAGGENCLNEPLDGPAAAFAAGPA